MFLRDLVSTYLRHSYCQSSSVLNSRAWTGRRRRQTSSIRRQSSEKGKKSGEGQAHRALALTTHHCTGLGKRVVPRLRELAPEGQSESGGGSHATQGQLYCPALYVQEGRPSGNAIVSLSPRCGPAPDFQIQRATVMWDKRATKLCDDGKRGRRPSTN